MNSEISSHTNPDHPFLRDLFRLRRYYELFQRFMRSFNNGEYIIVADSATNETYLKLCIKIEGILKHSKFSMLYEVYQRLFNNLLSFTDTDIELQGERSRTCAELQSKIDEMYARNGSKEMILNLSIYFFWKKLLSF